MMMKSELSNIAELKQEEVIFSSLSPALDSLIDVFFEAIVLPEGWKNWRLSSFVSVGSPLEGVDSSQNSL